MRPPRGKMISEDATCEMKTTADSAAAAPVFRGMKASDSSVTAAARSPMRYQRRGVSVRSATGPHRKRQMLDEIPIATIDAVSATGKPARVSTNASVTEAKPLLMPEGNTRKKNVGGDVVRRS